MCERCWRVALSTIALVGLLLAAGGSAQGQQAKLVRLTGGVTHRAGAAGEFVISRPGTLLPAGSRVRTDATGRAEIALPNGAVVRIAERTDLVLLVPAGTYLIQVEARGADVSRSQAVTRLNLRR